MFLEFLRNVLSLFSGCFMMNWFLFIVLSLILMDPFFLGSVAQAMPLPMHVAPSQLSRPIESGVLLGGKSADEFSILNVEAKAESASERLVISYGDRLGKPFRGEPGYFQVALDRESRRIVIDLAQVNRTAIEPRTLSKNLADSKFISKSEMTMDPADGSTNITLNLRAPVRIAVAARSAEQGQIVIDLQESRFGGKK